jgi:DNA modification methylase
MRTQLLQGDSLKLLREIPPRSVEAVVTDPPYGLSFMGSRWDYSVPAVGLWRECLRVLKPGGHLLSFSGTRTYHRMAVAIEDAGFELRDMLAWIYGSGFPKSLDVAKSIAKQRGESNTQESMEWRGWGTALKPAMEPIVFARKPILGTMAENVKRFRVGGLNIDGCRIQAESVVGWGGKAGFKRWSRGLDNNQEARPVVGRFPSNFMHDGSEEVVALFPTSKSHRSAKKRDTPNEDAGSAARFFYCAKAGRAERNAGLDSLPSIGLATQTRRKLGSAGLECAARCGGSKGSNWHPTVKPVALMRYLCRLVTPTSGVVLDPFMGSGTTGIAAKLEGFGFIGLERNKHFVRIAELRIAGVQG